MPQFRPLEWKESAGALDLSAEGNAASEILILLALPEGAGVEVMQGRRSVLRATASGVPARYRMGEKAQESFTSVMGFFVPSASGAATDSMEPRMGAKGVLLASPALLKRHLVSMTLPRATPGASTEGVGIQLLVDRSGAVAGAEIIGDRTVFAEAMRTEMLGWRFRPVLHEGVAVPAKAVFTVLLRPDGAIEVLGF